MKNDFEQICTDAVMCSKGGFLALACLAVIGGVSIIQGIANSAYRLGRETREAEMKKELKKDLKRQRKES